MGAGSIKLSQRIESALQRGRQVTLRVPHDRRALTEARGLSPNPLLVTRRLDRDERRPLSLASFLRWQKLAAQQVLLFPGASDDVPDAHTAKADRIWWAVGMKISRGRCQQELDDRVE